MVTPSAANTGASLTPPMVTSKLTVSLAPEASVTSTVTERVPTSASPAARAVVTWPFASIANSPSSLPSTRAKLAVSPRSTSLAATVATAAPAAASSVTSATDPTEAVGASLTLATAMVSVEDADAVPSEAVTVTAIEPTSSLPGVQVITPVAASMARPASSEAWSSE